jgi:ribosomal protein L7/L12
MDQLAGFLTGLTFGVLVVSFFFIIKTHSAVASIETRLRMLLKHHGIDMEQVATESVREHLKAGNKIEAIKVYRELTGASLAEAKSAVERLPVT